MRLTAQQKKNLYYLVPLIVLLIGTFLFYLLAIRVRPNDKILTNSEGVALFANENPTFEVQFGDKENPDGQWIRFEAKTSNDNPFSSEEKKNIFTKIANIFTPKKKSGIEMSLRGVDFSETEKDGNAQYDEEVKKVADILGTEEIKTSTVLTEMGREIGENEGDQNISKQTVVNQGVADGVDLEYQVLKGLGLKEEIVVNDLEAYRKSCDEGCKLPLNEFVFDIKMDSDVRLKKGWYTVEGKSVETYYFVNDKGKYLAHFLPNYAIDYSGNKTYKVDLVVTPGTDGNYEAKVTVDSDWLLDPNRTYPIRIDPSIVHDDSTDFSTGIPYGTKYFSGIGLKIADFSLVGSWNMNEAANGTCSGGGDICDQSGNNYNATITGTATPVSAYEMLGRDFDGVTGTYASLGDQAAFEVQSFTIEAYAKKEGTCGPYNYCTIMSKGGSGSKGFGFAIYGGKLHLRINDLGTGSTQFLTGTTTLSDNVWYYVAVSVDGVTKTINLYLNGNLEATGRYTDTISYGTENVKFGNSNSGNDLSMNGVIDSVRFWNVAKDANYIKNSYLKYGNSVLGTYSSSSLNLSTSVSGMTMSWLGSGVNTGNGETPYSTTGMVAQWNFNETSGTTAVSGGTCGTSCNGTLTNMTTTGQDAAAGTGWTANNRRWGSGAVMFDGTDDYVITASTSSFIFTGDFTYSSWINTGSTAAMANLYSAYASGQAGVKCGVNLVTSGKIACQIWANPETLTVESLNAGNDSKWHYVVFTRTGGTYSLFVDGILNSTSSSGQFNISGAAAFNIGRSTAQYFKGMIDSTLIYSRALSANEILSNYQAGNIEFQYRTSTDNSTWSNWTSYNDGALMFDGNDDYVDVGDIAAVDALTSFSTCAWVNNDTMTTDSMIWSKVDNSTWSGIMFVKDIVGQVSGRTNTYKIWVGQNSAAAFIEGATNSATTGAWQQVCATFTANSTTGLRLYINGVEDANSPVSTVGITGLDAGTNLLTIGKYNNGSSYVDGSIDNIQIYNRVLSGAEITSNYNMSDFETPYSSTGLLAFWKFNELSDATAVSGGTCGISCNGTLTNFSSTTGRDSSTTSGWTAKTKLGSDYPEYSFDNPYLYKTDDIGLVAYWPMEEVSGSGAYIKDVSTPFAVGGTVTYSGGYTIHTFKTSDTFVVNGSGKVEVLVVGGGGGGGDFYGGGGGAGGYQYNSGFSLTNGSYSVTIGNGGANNASGGNSVFSTITALGGGRGGLGNPQSAADAGGNGGSGGGMGGYIPSTNGTTPPLGYGSQGYNGGTGSATGVKAGAGGGGAGGVGGNASGATSGNGGVGVANSISGTSVYYAGGGGGGNGNNTGAGTGGLGGGGNGAAALYPASANGSNGIANTGGGGGGAAQVGTGGTGGSGVVIVRYPSSYTATTTDTIGDLTPTGTAYLNGKSGGARNFNGSSDYLSCTDANCGGAGKLDAMTGSISISAWVKPTTCSTVSVSPAIIDKFDTSASKGYMIYNEYYSGANLWTFYDPVNGYTRSTTPCITGVWTYITAVYDSSALTKKIYINGKLEATSTSQNPFGDSASDFNIGRYRGSSYYYNGIIDEVRVFNTPLSASTISSDYISGIANKGSVLSQNSSSLKLEGAGSTKLISGVYGVDSNTVALWHMDERSGTGAYIKDSSGNGYHATPSGTTYINGKVGGARLLNGTSNYIDAPDIDTLGYFTYEAWVKPTNVGKNQMIFDKELAGSLYPSVYMTVNATNTVTFGFYKATSTAQTVTSVDTLSAGRYYHLAGTYDGSNVRIYINGVQNNIAAASGTPNDIANNLTIGAQEWNASPYYRIPFDGLIDEVRISNIARTANEVAESYKLGKDSYINQTLNTIDISNKNTLGINIASDRPGSYLSTTWGESAFANYQPDINTLGLWHMDEISGGGAYIKDVSSYGNNGTPTGVTYTTSGKLGGARTFTSSTNYVDLGTSSNFGGLTAFTIDTWIYPTTITGEHRILDRGSSGSPNTILFFQSAATISLIVNNTDSVTTPSILSANQWYHVVAVYTGSGGEKAIYINGVKMATGTSTQASPTAGSIATWVGCPSWTTCSTYAFNGTIDELRLSNTARTADQIRQAYEIGFRTHNITVVFGAGLASGNLIANSGDTSFSIDATKYGLPALGSELYIGDKVIVKENYDGTEYIAQGVVSTVTSSTGAVTVSSWDSGSTFPSGGYTVNADVFKWQKEYIPVKNRTISNQVDATNLLTFRLNDGNEGRNIWIDDLRSSTGYLKNSSNEPITFTSNAQYVQYKAIFTSWDSNVTPYISQVQVDYASGGPTIDQLMRHGQWFDSGGAKKGFWWVGTH